MTPKSAAWNYPHQFQTHISNDPNNSTLPTNWHFKSMHIICNRIIRVILQNISETISLLCLKASETFSLLQRTGQSSSRSLWDFLWSSPLLFKNSPPHPIYCRYIGLLTFLDYEEQASRFRDDTTNVLPSSWDTISPEIHIAAPVLLLVSAQKSH